MKTRLLQVFAGALALLTPAAASAHEVYVLSSTTVAAAIAAPRFSLIQVLFANVHQFMFWAAMAALVVVAVFLLSISRTLERLCDPFLIRLKPYAHTVSRVTVGLALLAGAYFQASYGPELPLAATFGALTPFAVAVLTLLGVCITMNVFVRGAALIVLAFFSVAVYFHGWYMLTYATYVGEGVALLLMGRQHFGKSPETRTSSSRFLQRIEAKLAPYSLLILRISFGISLIYASVYAKFWHNNLALAVASSPLADHFYPLAHNLGFEPHFLVLGAGIIEVVLGLFFILGIEIRFTALFIEFWLCLSLLYFGETVWPHIILVGIPITFFLSGYDRFSLEGYFFKRGAREPVL